MPLLEISIIPVGTDSTDFSSEVINAVRKLKGKELHYDVTPTSTIIEGDLEQLWQVAKEIHQEAISSGPNRVITNIRIDHRKDKKTDMNHQINTVEDALHHS
ncbi:MTH1187 family thiamine-binding protein [Priestia aryabhattai]|uniref:MTH1187 family thiamine-binding protein n=1 Tax=Priestia aryabhattai TaxID=412384 RepID=UPI003D28B67E